MNEPTIINIPKFDIETQTSDNEDLRKDINETIINVDIKNSIRDNIKWEKRWRQIGTFFTLMKYICLIAVPILSLSSPQPFFKNLNLGDLFAYLSGALSSFALGVERISKLCENISKKKKEDTNIMLKKIGIKYTIEESDQGIEINSDNNPYTPKNLTRKFTA